MKKFDDMPVWILYHNRDKSIGLTADLREWMFGFNIMQGGRWIEVKFGPLHLLWVRK